MLPKGALLNLFINVMNRGGCLRKSVVQSACQYDVTSRISDFQKGEQSVDRRDGKKISNLSRKYCSDFFYLEILRSLLL